jgi:hypothetical protein
MLDAMVQLLTGSEEGFDPLFFDQLVDCMTSFDIDLLNIQVLVRVKFCACVYFPKIKSLLSGR